MSQEKTEEPTPKKLREARKRGEVPRSRELGTAAVLLAAAAAMAFAGDYALERIEELLHLSLRAAGQGSSASPTAVLEAGALLGLEAALPLLLMTLLAGTLASFLQVGPLMTFEPVAPKPQRLDPVKGAKNLLNQRRFVELVKSVLKIAIIGWVAWAGLEQGLRGIVGLAARDATAAVEAAGAIVVDLVWRVGLAMGAIAVLDVLYQRWRHRQDQKMTKDEVKREHKEQEGDPQSKQQRERTHREIIDHAAVEEVRHADVLVVNPTHLAVALRYDEEEHEAPEVTAKGQDALAQRMIAAAREAGVPVMRDVPLARALYDLDLGEEIPEKLYEAVAAVLRAAWNEREEQEGAP